MGLLANAMQRKGLISMARAIMQHACVHLALQQTGAAAQHQMTSPTQGMEAMWRSSAASMPDESCMHCRKTAGQAGRTTKLVPKLSSTAKPMAGPRTARGNTSPIMIHEMGPKDICSGQACRENAQSHILGFFLGMRSCLRQGSPTLANIQQVGHMQQHDALMLLRAGLQ